MLRPTLIEYQVDYIHVGFKLVTVKHNSSIFIFNISTYPLFTSGVNSSLFPGITLSKTDIQLTTLFPYVFIDYLQLYHSWIPCGYTKIVL